MDDSLDVPRLTPCGVPGTGTPCVWMSSSVRRSGLSLGRCTRARAHLRQRNWCDLPTVRAVVVEHEEHGCIHPWTGRVVPGVYVVQGPALYPLDALPLRCSRWCSSSVVEPTLPISPMPPARLPRRLRQSC